MTEANRYRRVIVVDAAIVTRNLALLKEKLGPDSFTVWAGRRSGRRFLAGLRPLLEHLEVRIDDGTHEPDNEIRATQILGGHPALSCAVALESHLVGMRRVRPGEGVSYGARFVATGDMTVGLVPIGFADGLDRLLTGSLRVRVDTVEVSVLGRIAMDSLSLDLDSVPGARLGSTVTVYGVTKPGQWGVADSAEALGITPVEIIARLSERAEVEWR